jgi:predicted metal-dependent HD superfamily phosphohydrolase
MPLTDYSHWIALRRSLGAKGDADVWHQRLLAAYGESARSYHNLRHLEDCLTELALVRHSVSQPALIEIALWFHDAVYDSHSATNEEDSAALALACLKEAGLAEAVIAQVRGLILCTKRHEPGDVPDSAVLIDIDLAILGQASTRFWEYERGIRAEYAWVPSATFAEKRAEILTRFLQRPTIYRTPLFQARYESAARINLASAIAHLRVGPGGAEA